MLDTVIKEVEKFGSDSCKRIYMNHGATEPLYGVSVGNLKKVVKQFKLKNDHELAMGLYNTGNYDLMYLSVMVADSSMMTKDIFRDWISKANMYMISDYVVARLLSETDFALELAREWLDNDGEFYQSAAYSTYSYLLGTKEDDYFDIDEIEKLLLYVKDNIHESKNRARYSMNNFVISVGASYKPLQLLAIDIAESIGKVKVYMGKKSCKVPLASDYIQATIEKGKDGIKRKQSKC